MISKDDEDQVLRSAALQTVESIRLARHRAERKAEATLREQANLLNLTHDSIFVRDIGGVINYWNRAAEELYGWPADHALGRIAHDLLRTEFPTPLEQIEQALLGAARWEGELLHTRRDGTQIVVASRWSLQRDDQGTPVAVLETNNDISQRKRAEALLAGEKRILEMMAKGNPLDQVLDSLCRLMEERAPGALASILLLDGDRLRHGGAPSLPKAYRDAIDGAAIGPSAGSCGTAAYLGKQIIVEDIATDPLWVNYRDLALPHSLRACWSTPIFSSQGSVIATFAIYHREPRSPNQRDRAVIEEIAHLAGIAVERRLTLAQAEEERERINQLKADLARVNRVTMMGELTASLAHEVNQPIAAAMTDANTCLRWLTRDLPDLDEAREAAKRTVKDVTRAGEIVSRMRGLFKKSRAEHELVDVNEIIGEIVTLVDSEAARSGVSIRTHLGGDLPSVTGDRIELQQVLLNLIMNGIEAMREVDRHRDLAITTMQESDEYLLVTVADTGIGLSSHTNEIFKAFFTTKPEGTGVGLAISRSIVQSHGGRLWAAPNAGHGATFSFTLPIVVAGV